MYDRIAADCITAVTDDGVDAALDPAKSKLFIIVTGNTFVQEASNLEITAGEWHYPNRMAQKIKEVFPNAGIEFLPEFPTGADNERVLVASSKYDETICMTFCKTGAYWGTDDLTRRVESVINALTLSGRLGAVVHFGNPFALQPLLHIPRKIFGYNMPDSQLYAIDVLAGTLPANGTLPYHISFQ